MKIILQYSIYFLFYPLKATNLLLQTFELTMHKKTMPLIAGTYLFKLFAITYIYARVGAVMVAENFAPSIDYSLVFYHIVVCGQVKQ